ncbi:hypothetical protein FNH72_09045 [Salmonella enterica subsp. arizonae]|uniref:ATP-binding protein n=1 Tax=Salmonella enterica subsp. arizonae TaxID=59203 RepID=A0A5Y3Q3N7_SALER|nr:hypothetical protein [Salmonella enterica]ECC1652956.1 hypothetical protein [Salmonella enterica subsp. arizonae]ECU8517418.1 hypothetical protein [Salmonella enterica subsp. arizonae serovar 44:z4,z23,z32:-]EDY0802989.1 hypothetical protein [Salmonella enterica subsp. arizonae serovar 62:z4,z23:-]EEE2581769.1 hypothetical protein [Salmonella enterica subsp. arizonae serovar 56:z4,z23:-]EIN8588224.1 hypothetical protein [Salmonella enterica subsp. arizonae serovar 41:z4,z23:-]
MSIRWESIRTFNNSQNNAFEELICQLAREEPIINKIDFRRVAAPDGGVEAYCVLDDGTEYGWQAKYFFSMGDAQWKQLKESFETALKTHPNLTKSYICIPLDRQDPRRKDQDWFMDKWNKKVAEWTQYAKGLGRNISIEYWGSSELTHRLSQENNAGRLHFWFSAEEFTTRWFSEQIEESTKNLGKRYTPELNVELDIARNFDAISRNSDFYKVAHKYFHDFLAKLNKFTDRAIHYSGNNTSEQFKRWISEVKDSFVPEGRGLEQFDINLLLSHIDNISKYLSDFEHEFIVNSDKKNDDLRYQVNNVWQAISDFSDFIKGPLLKLANSPLMILSGEAGIGKSHLLADIANHRIKSRIPCLLLLGQNFVSEESPWTQILRNILRVDGKENVLLGALNARAEAQGERLLFIIDAINEEKGRYFWPDYIVGMINQFSKYPWLGLVLSIRSSYEKLIVPKDFFDENKITRIAHSGFGSVEYQASKFFFSQYGIEQPGVPILHPEFSNPLFLKIFCEGLYRSGLNKIPKGYSGISNIISFFINSIEVKLSRPSSFNYPENFKLIEKTINELIEYKLNNDLSFIPYEAAFDIAEKMIGRYSDRRRFLDELISEGILSKNIYWNSKDNYEEGVYLAYERFEDHLTVSFLLDKYSINNNDALDSFFKENGELYKYIKSNYFYQGIIESLSIQLPERFGKELYELVEIEYKKHDGIIRAFISSLIWRKPDNIEEKTLEYINKYIIPFDNGFDAFMQMVYTVSSDPEHIYNADKLHKFLSKHSMAIRDSFWTKYLHNLDYYETSSMQRLIDWAGAEEDKFYLSDDSRLLAAKALSWLLTSTNIKLRDSATKSLANLLKNSIKTITALIDSFKDVNDPYVLERILAASYGAVLNSVTLDDLDKLSENIVATIFEAKEVYPNVLVRDYARNIIEYALYKKVYQMDNVDIIRPPYRSDFPTTFPTNEEIDAYKYDYNAADFKDYYWGQNTILSSMVTEYGRGICSYGDFGRYTFQSALSGWCDFDPNDLSNYACKLIFEKYGYDVEKHGQFDRYASEGDRSRNKKERIGKKYQWIALYEVLARIADNHQVVEGGSLWSESKNYVWFQGPWELFVRKIDPTTPSYSKEIIRQKSFWNNENPYNDWDSTINDWLKREANLPDPLELISVLSADDKKYLLLDGFFTWDEPLPLGEDEYGYAKKHLWYHIRSYLLKEDELPTLISNLNKDLPLIRNLPESHDQYRVFSREYYWSPAYQYFDDPYYGDKGWQNIYTDWQKQGEPIATICLTSESHHWESDSSGDNELSYLAPCEFMYHGMKLNYSENTGEWLDSDGDVIFLDPSIHNENKSALIVDKDKLEQFLLKNELNIVWVVTGEKNIHSMRPIDLDGDKWLEIYGIYTLKNNNVDGWRIIK